MKTPKRRISEQPIDWEHVSAEYLGNILMSLNFMELATLFLTVASTTIAIAALIIPLRHLMSYSHTLDSADSIQRLAQAQMQTYGLDKHDPAIGTLMKRHHALVNRAVDLQSNLRIRIFYYAVVGAILAARFADTLKQFFIYEVISVIPLAILVEVVILIIGRLLGKKYLRTVSDEQLNLFLNTQEPEQLPKDIKPTPESPAEEPRADQVPQEAPSLMKFLAFPVILMWIIRKYLR